MATSSKPTRSYANFKAGKYFLEPSYLEFMTDTYSTVSQLDGVSELFDLNLWFLLGEPGGKCYMLSKKGLTAPEYKAEIKKFAAILDTVPPELKAAIIADYKKNY